MEANFDVDVNDLEPKEITVPEKIRRIAAELLESGMDMVELVDDTHHYASAGALYQGAITALRKRSAYEVKDAFKNKGRCLAVELANGRVFLVSEPREGNV